MNGSMKSGTDIASLTPDQQAQLLALLDRLGAFATPELLVRTFEAMGIDPTVQADIDRADAVMAGAWAFDRLLAYLQRLRSLNAERMQLGDEIRRLLARPEPTTEAEVAAAARSRALAPHLAAKQEVVLNFFCASIQHIRSLLIVVADAVEYEIPPDDLAYLDEFRFLRNHFEHWYDRLPGKTNEAGLVKKELTEDEYRITGGLRSIGNDRVEVVEPKKSGPVVHLVDASNAGVARVEKIVEETATSVRDRALARVRSYFVAHPTDIPSPESVRNDLLFGVRGHDAIAKGDTHKPRDE
jgi:hypothetical protein